MQNVDVYKEIYYQKLYIYSLKGYVDINLVFIYIHTILGRVFALSVYSWIVV